MFVQSHIQRNHRQNHNNHQRPQSVAATINSKRRANISSAATSSRSTCKSARQTAVDSSGDHKSHQDDCQENLKICRKQQSGRITQRAVRLQTAESLRLIQSRGGQLADRTSSERDDSGLVASRSLTSDRKAASKSVSDVEEKSLTICEQRRELSLSSPSELIGQNATRLAIATNLRPRSNTTSGLLSSQRSIFGPAKRPAALCHAKSAQFLSLLSELEDTSGGSEQEQTKRQFPLQLTNETRQSAPIESNNAPKSKQVAIRPLSLRLLRASSATSRRVDCIRVSIKRRSNSTKANNLRLLTRVSLKQARQLAIKLIENQKEVDQCNESSSLTNQSDTLTGRRRLESSIRLVWLHLLNSYLKQVPHLILLYSIHFVTFQWNSIRSLFKEAPNFVSSFLCLSSSSSKLDSNCSPEMRNSLGKREEIWRHRNGRPFCWPPNEMGFEHISPLDQVLGESCQQHDHSTHCHPNRRRDQLDAGQMTRQIYFECCCNNYVQHQRQAVDLSSGIATKHQPDGGDDFQPFRQHKPAPNLFSSDIHSKNQLAACAISRSAPTGHQQVAFNRNRMIMLPPPYHELPPGHNHSIGGAAFEPPNWCWCGEHDKLEPDAATLAMSLPAQSHHWPPVDLGPRRAAFKKLHSLSGSFDEPSSPPGGARGPVRIHQQRISISSPILSEEKQNLATVRLVDRPSGLEAPIAPNTFLMQTQLDRRRQLRTRARDNCSLAPAAQLTKAKTMEPDNDFHIRHQSALAAHTIAANTQFWRPHANLKATSCAQDRPIQRKLSSIIGSDSELCKRSSHSVGLLHFSSSSVSSSLSSDANQLIRLARPVVDSAVAKRRAHITSDFGECSPRRTGLKSLGSSGRRLQRQKSSVTSETGSGQRHNSQTSCAPRSPLTLAADSRLVRNRSPSASSRTSNNNNETKSWKSQQLTGGPASSPNHQIACDGALKSSTGGGGGNRQKVNLGVSGKSKSMNHSLSPIATTLGRVSLAGAKRRLGFKQTRGLNSLSVHRSEEILPSEFGTGLLARQYTSTTTTTTNTTLGSNSLNDSCELDPQQLTTTTTTGSGSGLSQNKWLSGLGSESPDPKICFVDGLGLGQIVSRQALVSPYLGDIQIGLSDRRGMLEVEVIRVRQLQVKAGAKRIPSVYVKVYLMRNKKCLAKFKTSAVGNSLNPLYQQLFIFRDDYSNCVLQIIVWGDYGKGDRKSLMGIVQIHLNDLDISNLLVGWYKLLNAPSSQSVASSSRRLRQTLSTTKLADLSDVQQALAH